MITIDERGFQTIFQKLEKKEFASTNDRTNGQTNKQTNEQTNKRTNEQTNKQTIEREEKCNKRNSIMIVFHILTIKKLFFKILMKKKLFDCLNFLFVK